MLWESRTCWDMRHLINESRCKVNEQLPKWFSNERNQKQRSHSKRGGHPHLVLAPLCRMERGQRGWLFWKTVHAQSARVKDQARLWRGLTGQQSVVPACREVSGSWEFQETRAGLAVYKNSPCSLCLRGRRQAPREPVRECYSPLLPAGPSP